VLGICYETCKASYPDISTGIYDIGDVKNPEMKKKCKKVYADFYTNYDFDKWEVQNIADCARGINGCESHFAYAVVPEWKQALLDDEVSCPDGYKKSLGLCFPTKEMDCKRDLEMENCGFHGCSLDTGSCVNTYLKALFASVIAICKISIMALTLGSSAALSTAASAAIETAKTAVEIIKDTA